MKLVLSICFIVCTNLIFSQQDTNEVFENDDDFINQLDNIENHKKLTLVSYLIDSCLLKELRRAINNDSTCYFYIKQQSAYSLGLIKRDSIFYIRILPIYLHHITENNNYEGYFEAFNRKFLIYGQILDSIFTKNGSKKIEIEYYKGECISDSIIIGDIEEYKNIFQCNEELFYLSFIPLNCYEPTKKSCVESSRNKRRCKKKSRHTPLIR